MRRFNCARSKYAALLLAGLLAWALNTLLAPLSGAAVNAACLALLFGCLAAAALLMLWRRKRGQASPAVGLLLAGGFVVGLVFILKLPFDFSWHDLAWYSADFSAAVKPDGHLGYIAYLAQNGSLPLMDPRVEGFSVFYNPPLYHLLQAGFMRLNLWLGIAETVALENLQVLTLVCAAACPLLLDDLLRFLQVGERGRRAGALVMISQPMLWLMGATLNNDITCIMLTMACILFTVRWERTRRMGDIAGIALTLGLAMAVKLSSALLIPCIAMVFVVAFFRDLKRWKRYAGQFGAFLAMSVPPAVAWPLFHLIRYQMPLNYVRLPAETINVSGYTLWQRFGIPDWFAIRSLFYTGIRKTDHNVWMQTMKTGLFDERTLFETGSRMWYASYLWLVLFAGLLLLSLVLMIRLLVKKREGLSGLAKGFLGLYGGVLIANYLKFCVDYPYICTFNFRYILPVIMLCALAFACFADEKRAEGKRGRAAEVCRYAACGYIVLFALAGIFVYGVSFATH